MDHENNTDYQLWKRIKAGEAQAFKELYMQYADILFSFGFVYTKDKEQVKDCIHDLFFELFKYRKNLADSNKIRNYLFKSLKRKIQSSQTRNLRLVYTSDLSEIKEPKFSVQKDFPEDMEEMHDEIRKVMNRLPERQQEAINLRFQVGLPYAEVAKIMDISIESARTLVYRSVKTMREELKVSSTIFLLIIPNLYRNRSVQLVNYS